MEYQEGAGLMILTGAARVWQTDGKEFRSEKIIYNITTNTVNAGDSSGSDRVHITLQPKPKPKTPDSAPNPAAPVPVKEAAP